ncbi:tetratricopeptide repeat protein [Bombella apis]|nr:tetratricopeptide repeat protein [Bombella apis]MBR9730658.1 tetratricopeptide repeat protein [Bombella apis]MCL1510932.1 hypothetical protein [Parasaccharibacter sp. TMW 2.1884]QGT74755.1 tetratricopeptide repeat protein [Bombella sp. ESL0368]
MMPFPGKVGPVEETGPIFLCVMIACPLGDEIMGHSARPVLGPVSAILKSALGAVLLSCTASAAFAPAWAEDGLSREAIMRQHQALARQHDGGGLGDGVGSVDEQGEDLSAPLPTSSGDDSNRSSGVSSGRSGGDLVANLLERVNSLESQVREMHGQMEQMSNQLHQDEAAVAKQMGDMQFALENGHHAAPRPAPEAGEAAASAPAAVVAAPPATPQATSVADTLKAGRAALKAHQYEAAETQARQALKQSKTGWSRTEAQYLLAQSLAGQKSYKNAALTYYDVYSHSPDSPRAPEALLGVSASMLALGNRTASCEALQRLHKEFPNASARVKSSEKIFSERAGCH